MSRTSELGLRCALVRGAYSGEGLSYVRFFRFGEEYVLSLAPTLLVEEGRSMAGNRAANSSEERDQGLRAGGRCPPVLCPSSRFGRPTVLAYS